MYSLKLGYLHFHTSFEPNFKTATLDNTEKNIRPARIAVDLPFCRYYCPLNNKTCDPSERLRWMQVVPVNDKRDERRDPLYSPPTVRNETRVTSERQDDIMNYKMTVKAKVSSGFADPTTCEERRDGEKNRERETEITAANQPTSQLTDQTGSS